MKKEFRYEVLTSCLHEFICWDSHFESKLTYMHARVHTHTERERQYPSLYPRMMSASQHLSTGVISSVNDLCSGRICK